jgi:hypothetical protein
MDGQDLNRRIIGLLTLAYNSLPDLEKGETEEDFRREFGGTVDSLMEGWSAGYSVDVPLPPLQLAITQAALKRLEKEISADVMAAFGMFTGLFIRLCQEVEDKYPDADIPALLREIGLEAAGGD